MKSLRARIVGSYVGVGVFIVVIVSLLAATVLVEGRIHETRQAMSAVAAQLPATIVGYEVLHPSPIGIDRFLHERFAAQGVIVHVAGLDPMIHPPGLPARRVSFVGHLLASTIAPMHVPFPGGVAVLFADPQSLSAALNGFWIFVAVLAAVVLTASWRIAAIVADQTLRPLVNTTAALRRFGGGAFTKVAVRDDDRGETAELARAYNAAVDQTTAALTKRDQAEAEMRQFVADAGHQLRTPLTVVTGYLSAMLSRAQAADERETYRSMLGQARRMKSLIDGLVTLARLEHPDAAPPTPFDVNELMERVRAGFGEAARSRIAIHAARLPLSPIAHEEDVYEALCALVENSLKYAPDSEVELAAAAEGNTCALSVADRGPGIPPSDVERACDRFYRGANSDGVEGSGLGLSIARKSVERCGGSLQLENRPSGFTATIRLPCVEPVVDDERRVVAEPRLFINPSVANVRR